MAAIPIVTFDSGFSSVIRGALIDCPTEFFTLQQLAFYQACKPGWSRCPLGYSTYAAIDSMGRKLVVPGVYVPGEPAPKTKFPNYALRFSRTQIEEFLEPHLGLSEEVRSQRDREFKNLTHDLRAISTEIYHTALTARDDAEAHRSFGVVQSIDNVMAAQQMMSLRLDIVDYESGHAAGRPKERISVFKKVDKVFRCFANKISSRKLWARMEGNSYGYAFGPPIFEIIPFVIIENAIKYAPRGSQIVIKFEENESEIIVRFDSLGPKIKDNEKDRIFDRHFRGDAVQESERGGSGIGLYAAKTLLESNFSGKIFVNQFGSPIWQDGILVFETRFTIVVPRLPEDKTPHVISRRR